LINALGHTNITIRDLAQRSGVAVSTLYEAFGGKDELIAAALSEHYAGLYKNLAPQGKYAPMEKYLLHQEAMQRAMFGVREQSRAAISLYFSSTANLLREQVKAISWKRYQELLSEIAAAGDLVEGADVDLLCRHLNALEFSALHD
jgi:AcrR family transcriptional regulator